MNTPATRTVRRATPDDASTLARFRWEFRARKQAVSEEENAFLQRCVEWMRPRLRHDSRWRVWLLEEQGRPIGNLWLQMIEKIPNPGTEPELHAYVSNVFVVPEARGTGGGALLLDAAIADCKAHFVDAMFLWATDESRSLYARHGFSPPPRVLVNELSRPTPAPER
jgi:GNAT superfamily N-acetyltransferase